MQLLLDLIGYSTVTPQTIFRQTPAYKERSVYSDESFLPEATQRISEFSSVVFFKVKLYIHIEVVGSG